MEARQIEQNKIRQVAKDYEKNGYKVIIEPHGTNIPYFIKDYQPDIIATSEKDNVIIEVKTRSNFSTIDKLRDIADIVNNRENWRFELIVTTSKQEVQSEIDRSTIELGLTEIERNFKTVKTAIKQELYPSAFILLWAMLESIARQLLLEDKKKLNSRTSLVVIKTLFSFGHLTRKELDTLEKFFVIRNQIVHGYKVTGFNKKMVERLLSIVEKLRNERL